MLISLKSLAGDHRGKYAFNYSIDLSGENVNYDFPFTQPVLIDGQLEDRAGAVFFYAKAQYNLTVSCARCNCPVVVPKVTEIRFLLHTNAESSEMSSDGFYLDGDTVDTDQVIIPEILMDIDMAYLCKPECLGLCPTCGQDLNLGSCGCPVGSAHPELAKLKKLLENK